MKKIDKMKKTAKKKPKLQSCNKTKKKGEQNNKNCENDSGKIAFLLFRTIFLDKKKRPFGKYFGIGTIKCILKR